MVDDQSVRITTSLHDALSELVSEYGTLKIWVDQISIHQQDDREKAAQVQLMPRIYGQARRVIGWLGVEESGSDIAMKFLDVLGSSNLRKPDDHAGDGSALVHLKSHGLLREFADIIHPNSLLNQSATHLVQRAWFQRLWIVQEAVLAEDLVLRCGRASLSADTFFAGVDLLSSRVSDPPTMWIHRPYWNAYRLGRLRSKLANNETYSLVHLANVFSSWQCRRDQDRLNALMGIEARNRTTRSLFHPSYSISGPELYLAFAIWHLATHQLPDILHFAGRGYCPEVVDLHRRPVSVPVSEHAPGDLPSWTPDWRIACRPIALTNGAESVEVSGTPMTSSSSLHTTEGLKLLVRGIKMDTVKVCAESYWEPVMHDATQLFISWYKLAKDICNCENLDSLFASTLLMDGRVKPIDRNDPPVSKEEIDHLFMHWRSITMSSTPRSPHDSKVGLDESTRFGHLAEELCRYRRFFVTEHGRLGLGPALIGPGLSIYLIRGLTTPFMVRDGGSEHVLYGECFVSELTYKDFPSSDRDRQLCFI
jgi:hypothetical protein